MKDAILAGLIDPPNITEAEIKDHSKGDIISKTVVILQTTWFIAQCIARWTTKLSVTELEIITLGFCNAQWNYIYPLVEQAAKCWGAGVS